MNQSRHWAAWMAAWLIFLGLAILPREGAAWSGYIDPIEPVLFGDPDIPDQHARQAVTSERISAAPRICLPVVTFVGGFRVFYIYVSALGTSGIVNVNGQSASQIRMTARAPSR